MNGIGFRSVRSSSPAYSSTNGLPRGYPRRIDRVYHAASCCPHAGFGGYSNHVRLKRAHFLWRFSQLAHGRERARPFLFCRWLSRRLLTFLLLAPDSGYVFAGGGASSPSSSSFVVRRRRRSSSPLPPSSFVGAVRQCSRRRSERAPLFARSATPIELSLSLYIYISPGAQFSRRLGDANLERPITAGSSPRRFSRERRARRKVVSRTLAPTSARTTPLAPTPHPPDP